MPLGVAVCLMDEERCTATAWATLTMAGVLMLPAATARGQPASADPAASPAPVVQVGGEADGRLGRSMPTVPAPSPQAPAGQALPPMLAVTQLEERSRVGDLDVRLVSIRAPKGQPVLEVLLELVRESGFSLVPDPEVSGEFVGELQNVTLRHALDLVLRPLGFDYAVQDRSIRVFRRRLETRLLDVNLLGGRRAARRWPVTSGLERGVPDPTEGPEVLDELLRGVQALLSGSGRAHLDRAAGLLQVTDYPERLDRIRLYLDTVQQRLGRQVSLMAQVIEVELQGPSTPGIDWAAVWRASGVEREPSETFGRGPVARALRAGTPARLLAALGAQGRVRLLAAPRAAAMHNEPLWLRVATDEVLLVPSSRVDETTGRSGAPLASAQVVSEGVLLGITPHIGADGVIQLHISPRVAARARSGAGGPALAVREADTMVRAYDGETVVIAGLISERIETERRRPPVVGALPVVGGAFERETRRTVRTELVVLLSASIVTPGRTIAAVDEPRR